MVVTAGLCCFGMTSGAIAGDDDCFDKGSLTFGSCGEYDWTGPYVGVHVGYAELDHGGGYNTQQQAEALFARDLDVNGVAYGLQLGYNVMAGEFVFGVELDGSIFDEDDTISNIGADNQNMVAEANAFGSLRARLGFPIDDLMPFVTGGVGLVDYELTVNDIANAATFNEEETLFAGVIGGGLEWGVTREVTFRAEGLYYYVDEGYDFIEPGAAEATTTRFEDLWTVRGALNYRF